MIDLIFYISFLIILGAIIVFFLRQKGSYFKSVKILFVIAFTAFAAAIFFDFAKNHIIQDDWMVFYATAGGLTALFVTAVSVEHAALVLYKKRPYPEVKKTSKKTLTIISVSFKAFTLVLLIIALTLVPWSPKRVKTLWGDMVYSPEFASWFLYALGGYLIFVILYPCALLMLSSLRCKDKLVANALAWLGTSWLCISFTLILFNGVTRSLGYETIEVGYTLNMIFFAGMAYYFKKTTILEGFFENPQQVLQIKEGEHIVVSYTSKVNKMKIFANYVYEGLQRGDRIVYAFPDEENTIVRLRLKELGIDVEKHEKDGSLVLMRLSEAYLSNSHFNKERLIEFWKHFIEESKKKGFKHERDLFDLGDLGFLKDQENTYLDYLRDANTQIMDTYLTELRAINVEKLNPKFVEEFKFLTTKSMDLLEHTNSFSKQLGLAHQELVGRNLLLEIDPASNYEILIQDFALEAAANIEPVAAFTTKGSAVHSILSKRENVRFFLLTQLVSVPQTNGLQKEILLPSNNTSLLLDALDKTLKAYSYGNKNIIFDNLSNLVLSVGFEKTFNFMRYALDLLSSKKTTALFLFSPSAHDFKVASGLRSLFNDQLVYDKNGLGIAKLYEPKEVSTDMALVREVKE
jgi:hypothetical protein